MPDEKCPKCGTDTGFVQEHTYEACRIAELARDLQAAREHIDALETSTELSKRGYESERQKRIWTERGAAAIEKDLQAAREENAALLADRESAIQSVESWFNSQLADRDRENKALRELLKSAFPYVRIECPVHSQIAALTSRQAGKDGS